jgi:hypothetical protein
VVITCRKTAASAALLRVFGQLIKTILELLTGQKKRAAQLTSIVMDIVEQKSYNKNRRSDDYGNYYGVD